MFPIANWIDETLGCDSKGHVQTGVLQGWFPHAVLTNPKKLFLKRKIACHNEERSPCMPYLRYGQFLAHVLNSGIPDNFSWHAELVLYPGNYSEPLKVLIVLVKLVVWEKGVSLTYPVITSQTHMAFSMLCKLLKMSSSVCSQCGWPNTILVCLLAHQRSKHFFLSTQGIYLWFPLLLSP